MAEETKKLYRSKDDCWVAGVCGGIGRYFNLDPTLIRALFVIFTLFGGSGILLYLILWLIIPEEPGEMAEKAGEAEEEVAAGGESEGNE